MKDSWSAQWDPEDLQLLATVLLIGRSPREIERQLGLSEGMLSKYKTGRRTPSRETLQKLAAERGLTSEFVESEFLPEVRRLRLLVDRGGSEAALPLGPLVGAGLSAGSAFSSLLREAACCLLGHQPMLEETAPRFVVKAPSPEDRKEAPALWGRLQGYSHRQRLFLVREVADFHSWSLCEWVCQESIDAAADDADRAVELAELALAIAERVPGDEAQHREAQGYAWAHLGNARRVQGNLNGAEEGFSQFRRHWLPEEESASLLSKALVLGLESTLRREQRDLVRALDLLDQALAVDQGRWTPHLLNNRARIFIERGEYEEAISILCRADALLPQDQEPRLRFGMNWNRASCLCHLERYEEAEMVLSEVLSCSAVVRRKLDAPRLRWVEGRVAAGFGKTAEALAALEEARESFLSRQIAYDAALVTLEIAALHLDAGRTAEVKELVREMAPVFESQGVHREALAALRLFKEAVQQEDATAALAREMINYLYKARHDPERRFESKG